jgi:signal transduction histidine kinase
MNLPGVRGMRHLVPSYSDLQRQVTELVEQQAAISEVLRAVANSPHDLQPIFDTILINATRLCRATFGAFVLFEGKGFRTVARRGPPNPVYAERLPLGVVHPIRPGDPYAQLVNSGSPVQIADLAADQLYLRRDPIFVALVELADVRTCLFVPLRKDNELFGALVMCREQVQPFTDSQIDLVRDFAVQATIALECTRRERQYREAQMALAHANRVATMGQLTASITHEVSQPITATVTYALAARRWLSAKPPDFGEVSEALAGIIKEGNRATEVIERIRALIKKAPCRKDAVSINDAILEVVALTRTEATNNGVLVRTQLAEGLPPVEGDRVQLQQVMLNLIVNAVQSMSGVEDGNRELHISTVSMESEGVCVAVRDTGHGLSPESLSRLFEPFYTTKPEGVGIGLSICRSIIEAHGGRLWAIPREPQGALFQFTIPAA